MFRLSDRQGKLFDAYGLMTPHKKIACKKSRAEPFHAHALPILLRAEPLIAEESKMKKIAFFAALGFLSAGVFAQNIPVRRAPEQKKEAGSVTADVLTARIAAQPAALSGIEELKMRQGLEIAELKRKQQEELKQMKERLKVSYNQETHDAIEVKKREYRQSLKSLKDAQNKEMDQFRKDHAKALKHPGKTSNPEKTAAQAEKIVPADKK